MAQASPLSPVIILNAPQLAENIGAVARVMANFGLADLRLVNPRDGWPQERAWALASGAEWPLNAARVYDTVADAIADLQVVYATTARPRELTLPVVTPRTGAAQLAEACARGERCGLLFGGERAGLETSDIALCQAVITIPIDPRFYYDYVVYGYDPTTTQMDAGVTHAMLYRQEYGQDGYYYVRAVEVAEWYGAGPNWRYKQGSSRTRSWFQFYVGNTYNETQDFSKPALDSNEICLQIGTAMCSANSRLFSTGLLGGASSKLYYSRVDRPFAFREFIQFIDGDFVPNSGGSRTFDGEVIQSIVPIGSLAGSAESLGSPTVGTTTLMVLTDYNLYEMSGYDALSLNRATARGPYGTLSPYSVARSRLGIAWLSNSGQVMQYDGSLSFLGLNQVDNKTTTIPAARKVWAGGVYCNDVYRLLYTPTGGSANTKALCYDYRLVAWESEDTFTLGNPDLILAGKIGDVVGVLAFATSGGNVKCFRYEEPSNTNAVDFKVKFAELANSSNYMLLQAMGVQGTKTSGQTVTLTTTRATKGSTGGVASGTITVNDSSTFYWKWDDLGVGVEAGTIQPEISGSINGGVTLYRVFAEIGTGVKGVSR